MRYIIAPLDLTTEQMEIYKLLYSKMDFDTYLVKYTLDQLATDSNPILLLTKKKVNRIIKNFVAENMLTVMVIGTKGNPTIYKVIRMKDLYKEHKGNECDTQKERIRNTKGTNKASDTNTLEDVKEHKGNEKGTQKEQIGNAKVTPFNDIDKDKDKDKYIDLFNFYIKLDIIKHKALTPAMKKAIDLAIKQNSYSVEDCKALLQKHKKVIEDTKGNDYPVKRRTLVEFFGQKISNSTALICTQYEEGGKFNTTINNVKANDPNRIVNKRRDDM